MKIKIIFTYAFLCFFAANTVDAQIFRFYHKLSQSSIENANFTLHRSTVKELRPEISITAPVSFNLVKDLIDTIETRESNIELISSQNFTARVSSNTTAISILAAGIKVNLVSGVEYNVPPNTPVILPIGDCFVTANTQNVVIRISKDSGLTMTTNRVRKLTTTLVRLVGTTKGVINVSGGKITFDPWQIKAFNAPPSGIIDVDNTTPVPLDLRDNRQKIGDPTKVLRVPYSHNTVSINSVPFRYRGRKVLADTVHTPGTVTTAFSLAFSLGRTWGFSNITTRARNDYSFTLGAFIGPSSVELKKETVDKPDEFKPGRTNPIISYGLNAIFARNGLGILLAAGFDNAIGKFGNNWIYDNDFWFGFGISVSFPK